VNPDGFACRFWTCSPAQRQTNLVLFNGLFEQLGEILVVGKGLYKGFDAAKLKDCTFSELMKKVQRSTKNNGAAPAEKTGKPPKQEVNV